MFVIIQNLYFRLSFRKLKRVVMLALNKHYGMDISRDIDLIWIYLKNNHLDYYKIPKNVIILVNYWNFINFASNIKQYINLLAL